MNINITEQKNILVVTPQKPEDGHALNLSKVKTQLMGRKKRDYVGSVLDLTHVDMIDSSAIGAIVGILRFHNKTNTLFAIAGIGLRVAETLTVANLLTVLPVRLKLEEALEEMQRVPPGAEGTAQILRGNPTIQTIREAWEDSGQGNQPGETEKPESAAAGGPESFPAVGTKSVQSEEEREYFELIKSNPELQDWLKALEIFLKARELSRKYGIAFSADTSFKEFLSQFAEHLGDAGKGPEKSSLRPNRK